MRRWLGALLLVVFGLRAVPTAVPSISASSSTRVQGASQRGPGAALRAPLERAWSLLAEGRAAEVVVEVDRVLLGLKPRVHAPDEVLDAETIREAARDAATLRVEAVLAGFPDLRGSRRDFLRSIAGEATYGDWAQGVPASITLAQAILESSWGNAAPGFNWFGLKGVGPAGSVERRVVEYRHGRRRHTMAAFRLYDDPADAIRDHGEILATRSCYARARAAGDDVEGYARGLVGVYATDPRYADKLMRLITSLSLDRFDWRTGTPWL